MKKSTNIILLLLALLFTFVGVKSLQHSIPYAQLTGIESINGTILKLHCPYKGAAALSLNDKAPTFNLSVKFKTNYCDNDHSQALLGKNVQIKAQKMNNDYYQVYMLTEGENVILLPQEIESDRSSSTFGLFFLAFLLVALVVYKNRQNLHYIISNARN
jgi:hypothetical protein